MSLLLPAVLAGEMTTPRPTTVPAPAASATHLPQLDGWRGVSIVCVLLAHMFPLGPKEWELNTTAGAVGMAVFFTLSGFLITSFLRERPAVGDFLIRRGCRILPLALLYLAVALTVAGASPWTWAASFGFVLNYSHDAIIPWTSPFWSLCVEIHFYLLIAGLVAVLGRRGLFVLPPLAVAVTIARVVTDSPMSIYTHLRVDEILAGATLALVWGAGKDGKWAVVFRRTPPWLAVLTLLLTSSPWCGPLQYARPYAAALLVGCTLFQERHWLSRQLLRPSLKYLANVSYALYVLHPMTYRGWMDTGTTVERYLIKRPVSLAVLFALAHLSTRYWEAWWIRFGKRLTGRAERRALGLGVQQPQGVSP
jgi:peptidoglycan/LPS O-acetylase OafA/YrhL